MLCYFPVQLLILAIELPELTFSHVWAFITRRLPSIELDIARNLRQTRSKCLHCILDLQRREVCSRQASLKEIETLADLRGMPKNTMVACETCENNRERGDETTSRCSIIWFNKQTNRLHIVELLWRREADSPNVIQAAIHKLPLYDNSEKTANEVRNQQHLVVASQNEVPRTRRAGGRQEITPANHASRLEVNNRRVSDPPRRLYRYSTLRERRRSASPPLNHMFPARRRLVQRSRSPITNRRITSLSDGTGVNGYPRQQQN